MFLLQKLNTSAAATLRADDVDLDVAQSTTKASAKRLRTESSLATDAPYGRPATVTDAHGSTAAVTSPTDSQVTFGAPESSAESHTPGPVAARKITWDDLKTASQLHPDFPTVISLADDDRSWEIWCDICGANVKVDEHGNPDGLFDGASGLYKHIVDAHVGNFANDDLIVKHFKFRKVSIKDRKAIRSGKEPGVTIAPRTPFSDKKSPSNKQTNKRPREDAEEGEATPEDTDSDLPTHKKKRQSAIVGRKRLAFQYDYYGQPKSAKTTKRKTNATKRQQLEVASEASEDLDQVEDQFRNIFESPKSQMSSKPNIMAPHKAGPETVRAQAGQPSDEKGDEEALLAAMESEA